MNTYVNTAVLLFAGLFAGLLRLIANSDFQAIYEALAALDDNLPQGAE
jgi:hypothetical protein